MASNDDRPVNPRRDERMGVEFGKPLVERLPVESEAVVQAARAWLNTHPEGGPVYVRAHPQAIEDLKKAIRALNWAETEYMREVFNGEK